MSNKDQSTEDLLTKYKELINAIEDNKQLNDNELKILFNNIVVFNSNNLTTGATAMWTINKNKKDLDRLLFETTEYRNWMREIENENREKEIEEKNKEWIAKQKEEGIKWYDAILFGGLILFAVYGVANLLYNVLTALTK